MSRIRTVKPCFFLHEDLFDAEKATGLPLRLAYIGIWGVCDREGRFLWRARQIKTDVLPYDDDVDFSRVLDALWTRGFLVKYASGGTLYGCVPSWDKHQVVNNRERESEIPAPTTETLISIEEKEVSTTRAPRVDDACPTRSSLSLSYSPSLSSSENKKEFDEFWELYPQKVGRRDAERAFINARKRHSLKTLLDGLRRYLAKEDDRPWCNPATWLNQDRCLDEPASRATAPPKLSKTQQAARNLQERLKNGQHGGRDIREQSSEHVVVQLPKPSPRPGNHVAATDDPVHREAKVSLAADGSPGRRVDS